MSPSGDDTLVPFLYAYYRSERTRHVADFTEFLVSTTPTCYATIEPESSMQ